MAGTSSLRGNPPARPEAITAGERWRFTVLTDSLLRMEYQPSGRFTDEASQRVLNRDFPAAPYSVTETETKLRLSTGRLRVEYGKAPFSPTR
jgi:hypothetical protein